MKKNKVFLGGTCNGSQWREILIPKLKIDYFNPVVEDWNEEAQRNEEREKDKKCNIKLYVITPKMTGVYSIAEVIDSCWKDRNRMKTYGDRIHFTVFCYLYCEPINENIIFSDSQRHSLDAVKTKVVALNGRTFSNLKDVATYLNFYNEK